LAALEVLVHTEDPRILSAAQWSMISVDVHDSLIETLQKPPPDWRELPAPASTRALGSRWVAEARSVVLQVPSIVVDGEFNYLLNPQHSDFARLTIGQPIEFSYDPRLSR
jgi:RES domain-containing protein